MPGAWRCRTALASPASRPQWVQYPKDCRSWRVGLRVPMTSIFRSGTFMRVEKRQGALGERVQIADGHVTVAHRCYPTFSEGLQDPINVNCRDPKMICQLRLSQRHRESQ